MAQTQTIKQAVGHIFETTDATQSTAVNIPTNTNEAYLVTARIIAVDTTDYAQAAGYTVSGTFLNDGGSLAIVGAVNDGGTDESDSNWDATLDASGTNIRVRVTGEAAKTITWRIALDVLVVGAYSTPQVV